MLSMAKPKTNAEGLALVFSKISRAKLASELGVVRQLLYRWDEVPFKYVLDVERITGVPRHEIVPETAAFFLQHKD